MVTYQDELIFKYFGLRVYLATNSDLCSTLLNEILFNIYTFINLATAFTTTIEKHFPPEKPGI